MLDKLAEFTMRTDCRLTRVVTLAGGEELHACATCKATLLVKSGQTPVCPVRRLLDYQRSRAANEA
jgi:hypothetical protein